MTNTATSQYLWLWLISYAALWAGLSASLDPAVPYDAVEALNWGTNGQWGSPKNPWLVGLVMRPLLWFPSIPANIYWYVTHFIAVTIGMLGVWLLARRLSGSESLAWLALLSLNLSGVINFDIISYNDNYLLVMLWPWLMLFFLYAAFDHPRWWLPFALVAGLALMTKYSTIAFIGMIFLLTLVVPQIRRCYSRPEFYFALLLWFLLITPNIWWLWQHDFAAFKWLDSQIQHQLNPFAFTSALLVFYPLLILCALIYAKGGRIRWPQRQQTEILACLAIVLVPLLLILLLFTFKRGGRLTEWLQPFMIVGPALLVACINPIPKGSWRNLFIGLTTFGLLVGSGYALVMLANIRDAGQKMMGIQPFSLQIEQRWQHRYGMPLRYVGGATLAEWMTFYAQDRPEILTPWSLEHKPNVYNANITESQLAKQGALLFGPIGESCQQVSFAEDLAPFPNLRVALTEEVHYQSQPSVEPRLVCLGFIAPAELTKEN